MHIMSSLLGYYKPIPKGTVALVTGSSHGIGRCIAEELAKRGCDLILVGRDQNALNAAQQQLVKQYRVTVATIRQDLAILSGADQLYDEVRKLNLTVDVLVNNAGLALNGEFAQMEMKVLEDVVLTNCMTHVKLTRHFLPGMIQRKKGWILNTSSLAAFIPGPYHAIYHATKAFMTNFSYSIHYEVKSHNVTVSQLTPGPVYETELGTRAEMDEAWGLIISPGHLPESIAKLAVEGLERGDSLILAKRHYLPVVVSKLLPADFTMPIGALFNLKPVPESIKKFRFSVARTLGF